MRPRDCVWRESAGRSRRSLAPRVRRLVRAHSRAAPASGAPSARMRTTLPRRPPRRTPWPRFAWREHDPSAATFDSRADPPWSTETDECPPRGRRGGATHRDWRPRWTPARRPSGLFSSSRAKAHGRCRWPKVARRRASSVRFAAPSASRSPIPSGRSARTPGHGPRPRRSPPARPAQPGRAIARQRSPL